MCSLNQCNAEKTFFFGATVEAGFPGQFCSGNGSGLKLPGRSASVQAVPVKRSWCTKGHWWDQKDGINHLRDCLVLSAVCCTVTTLTHVMWVGVQRQSTWKQVGSSRLSQATQPCQVSDAIPFLLLFCLSTMTAFPQGSEIQRKYKAETADNSLPGFPCSNAPVLGSDTGDARSTSTAPKSVILISLYCNFNI